MCVTKEEALGKCCYMCSALFILPHFSSRKGKMITNWHQLQMAGKRKARKVKGTRRIWMSWRKKLIWWVHKQKWIPPEDLNGRVEQYLQDDNAQKLTKLTVLNFINMSSYTYCLLIHNNSLIETMLTLLVTVSHCHLSQQWHSHSGDKPRLWPHSQSH